MLGSPASQTVLAPARRGFPASDEQIRDAGYDKSCRPDSVYINPRLSEKVKSEFLKNERCNHSGDDQIGECVNAGRK
jgi:hypothetical protein